jgi:hypothetical protein
MLLTLQLSSQTAYRIDVTLKPFRSGYLYLAHHYGKKQILVDSAAIDSNSKAVFTGKTKLPGGIYMIAFPKKDGWFEIVIDKEQNFSIVGDSSDLLNKLVFTGSADNQLFKDYQKFTVKTGSEINRLQKSLATAKTKQDSAEIQKSYSGRQQGPDGLSSSVHKGPSQAPAHFHFCCFERTPDPIHLKRFGRYLLLLSTPLLGWC